MIRTQIKTDTRVLGNIERKITQAPSLMETALNRQLTRLRRRFIRLVEDSVPPESNRRYPFVWSLNRQANERARRWYFANKVPRGSKGGRYKRSGRLVRSFRVEKQTTANGGILSVRNDAPGALYTIGQRQIHGHAVTGWQQVQRQVDNFSPLATEVLRETWFTVMSPSAGVR